MLIKDCGDIIVEVMFVGDKGFYDCLVMFLFFGLSDVIECVWIEGNFKKDKLVKVIEFK